MVKLNCYDIKTLLEAIDLITNQPYSGKMMQPRSIYWVYRTGKFRIHYTIEENIIKIVSFSKDRDYSELL